MSGRKILAISYDKSLLDTRKMILELHGFDVVTALGYQEALGMCRQKQNFDLVIVGHSIPKSDKELFIDEIRKTCSAPVLAIRRPGDPPLPGVEYSIDALDGPEALIETVQRATGAVSS
jgi:DNA-binding response OmpR family regulator